MFSVERLGTDGKWYQEQAFASRPAAERYLAATRASHEQWRIRHYIDIADDYAERAEWKARRI